MRAHVLICTLAAYLTWHLRKTLAPLTYTDEQPPQHASPVTPARRSQHAAAKAAAHASPDGQILHSFRGLLGHLATLTRSTITIGGASFDKISDPTPVQRRAHPADPHPEVDRTPAPNHRETAAQRRIDLPQVTKLRANRNQWVVPADGRTMAARHRLYGWRQVTIQGSMRSPSVLLAPPSSRCPDP